QGGERAMDKAARGFETAPRRVAVGHAVAAEAMERRRRERGGERDQQRGVETCREPRRQVEERKRQERASDAKDRPQGRPGPLPEKGEAGREQAPLERARGGG